MKSVEPKKKKTYQGEVVSDKMDKTVVVTTRRVFTHKKFHKIMRIDKKYKVHDPEGLAHVGDTVEFVEGRPVSKTKYMYLVRVIS